MDYKLLGAAIVMAIGVALGGFLAGQGYFRAKSLDRTVVVKGLSEREVAADIAIWPVKYTVADNSLEAVYSKLETQSRLVRSFLEHHEFTADELTISAPSVTDKQAQSFGDANVAFRYSGTQSVTVYSNDVGAVRAAKKELVDLGKAGVAVSGDSYDAQTQFLFTGLNNLKPEMIEEATRKAREVAEKFAEDSNSSLGGIKFASQGQFSISDRDSSTPYVKRVRVVSTIEYYLRD